MNESMMLVNFSGRAVRLSYILYYSRFLYGFAMRDMCHATSSCISLSIECLWKINLVKEFGTQQAPVSGVSVGHGLIL